MKSILVKAELAGGHVHTNWWMGEKNCTRGNCGSLVFRDDEWDEIESMLERSNGLGIHVEISRGGFEGCE